MRVLSLFFASLWLASGVLAQTTTELVIDVTHTPSNCTVRSKKGDALEVHYTGRLFTTGEKFDSSVDRGPPFSLTLGAGEVIQGWDQGLEDMCVGETRKLTIPPHLAYGSEGVEDVIPPNSVLVFETELVGLTKSAKNEELESAAPSGVFDSTAVFVVSAVLGSTVVSLAY